MTPRRLLLAVLLLAGCTARPPAPDDTDAISAPGKLRLAEAAEAAGNSDMALSMFAAAASSPPDDPVIQARAAEGLMRGGKRQQARDLLLARLAAHPDSIPLRRTLAAVDITMGQPAAALAELDKIPTRSLNDDILTNKAVALDMLARHTEAQALYRAILTRIPDDAATLNDLTISLLADGNPEAALQSAIRLMATDTPSDRARTTAAIAYAANGQTQRALSILPPTVSPADLQTLTDAALQKIKTR